MTNYLIITTDGMYYLYSNLERAYRDCDVAVAHPTTKRTIEWARREYEVMS